MSLPWPDYRDKHYTDRFHNEWELETRPPVMLRYREKKVIEWEEVGIPHNLVEFHDCRDGWSRVLQGTNSVAALLLGQCTRGHFVEFMPHPSYMEMGTGCPRGKCPGVVHPATEEAVVLYRLLGKEKASYTAQLAWQESRGAGRR